MVDKTLNKANGFAVQICVLLKSDPVITMGEAVPFPSLKILSIKTVNSYVVMNETIDARGKSDEPSMAKVAIVKRKTGSKNKSESNEEATGEAPVEVVSEKVVSKKRPTVDSVPLQTIKTTPIATAEQPPVPKRKSNKRKLRLSKGSDDENVEERVAVENVENVEKPITVEVTVGEIVVEPTEEERHASAQLETTDDVDVIIEQWFDRSYDDFVSRDAEQLIVSTSDLDKRTGTAETVAGEQQVPMFVEKRTVAESEGTTEKGKALLEEADTVKGNPAREMVQFICADVDFLVQLRQQVMQDVVEFFHSFRIKKISYLKSLRELSEKEKHMLLWAETNVRVGAQLANLWRVGSC
ncbi:hypothetical protein F511_18103 [Dorcoceras hygrometricum]|uniref:Uncharacterized protein n=1 Tax=Dorcoceras hygrometricum TaxID=472368 RepID=A0A2Z7BC70_9LAMI|nr:hypothetical protein F511_18103 [Dorcoceras hygrometricum]